MFRFTIRKLLLLTVIVVLGLGWSLSERRWRAARWETKAKALEFVVEAFGWDIELKEEHVYVKVPGEKSGYLYSYRTGER